MSDEAPAFEGRVDVGQIHNINAPAEIGVLHIKYVRYPGTQQLTVWLPQHGYFGYRNWRLIGPGERVLEDVELRSRLNGTVQILTDTLPWPPGAYRIEVTHEGGWRHVAELEKFPEDAPAPKPPPAPLPEPVSSEPIVYRDGAGNIIPNLDLEMRAQALEKIVRRFGRYLEYEGNYRAGVIVYVDGDRRIRFQHEMAGGSYKFIIDVPPAKYWEAQTGTPLSERDEIVRFVAEQVQREQASDWTFEIRENEIAFR